MILRTVTGTIKKTNGSLWAGAALTFTPFAMQNSAGVTVPIEPVSVITNDNGLFTAELFTLAGSYLRYFVDLPSGEKYPFDLPDAVEAAQLSALLLVALLETPLPSNTAALQALINTHAAVKASALQLGHIRIDGSTITIDADGIISAPAPAAILLTGNQVAAGVKTFSSSPIVPTPTTGLQAVNKDYVDANSSNPNAQYALRFDATKNTHVDHGPFWLPGVNYTTFYWDALIRPTLVSNTGYFISAGYGGAHDLLFGTTSGTTKFAITGNIWNGAAVVSFATQQKFFLGEWYHVAAAWDGTEIIVYVNGVVEGVTAYVAANRSTLAATDSVMFVGGSDHAMWSGDLAWIRGFEGALPILLASYVTFRTTKFPRAAFNNSGSAIIKAQFLADYSQPAGIIADQSDGLNGVRHPGIRSRGANLGGFLAGFPNSFALVADADLPQWVSVTIEAPNVVEVVTVPPTAKVYDSFSNREYSPFWSDTQGLGSTEGGTSGIVAWANAASLGISSGSVFAYTTVETVIANVQVGSQTQDIRVNRTGDRIMIVGRYVDDSNYVYAQFYYGGGISYYNYGKIVAGVYTDFGTTNTLGFTDADIRLTISGNTVQIYSGGVLRNTTVDASLPTGTKAGINIASHWLTKVNLFEVY